MYTSVHCLTSFELTLEDCVTACFRPWLWEFIFLGFKERPPQAPPPTNLQMLKGCLALKGGKGLKVVMHASANVYSSTQCPRLCLHRSVARHYLSMHMNELIEKKCTPMTPVAFFWSILTFNCFKVSTVRCSAVKTLRIDPPVNQADKLLALWDSAVGTYGMRNHSSS